MTLKELIYRSQIIILNTDIMVLKYIDGRNEKGLKQHFINFTGEPKNHL